MFADDITITAVADSQTQYYEHNFEICHQMGGKHKLVLNVNKIKNMIICTTRTIRKLKPWHLTYGSSKQRNNRS